MDVTSADDEMAHEVKPLRVKVPDADDETFNATDHLDPDSATVKLFHIKR